MTDTTALVAAVRRREKRRPRRRDLLVEVISGLIATPLISLYRGLFLMLGVGIVHHEWISALPTIGYWWATLLVLLLNGVFSAIDTTKHGGRDRS